MSCSYVTTFFINNQNTAIAEFLPKLNIQMNGSPLLAKLVKNLMVKMHKNRQFNIIQKPAA